MSILTVISTTIEIGSVTVDAYTANQISSVTGSPINYLSGKGLAESIGLTDKTTRPQSLPKELKAILGEAFTTRPGKCKTSTGGVSQIGLWDTPSATQYYLYHALKGNKTAKLIMVSLASTSLDIIINDKFGREYEKGSAERWAKLRANSKNAFWQLEAATDHYLAIHPDKAKQLAYTVYLRSNYQDEINCSLFGKTAYTIRKELGIPKPELLRDHYCHEALRRIDIIQSIAAANIINKDVEPQQAVKEALHMMKFDVIDYCD